MDQKLSLLASVLKRPFYGILSIVTSIALGIIYYYLTLSIMPISIAQILGPLFIGASFGLTFATAILAVKIHGMSCQGCVSNITSALKSIKGVKGVDVNLEKRRAVIRFDSEHTDESDLKKTITKAGYTVGDR